MPPFVVILDSLPSDSSLSRLLSSDRNSELEDNLHMKRDGEVERDEKFETMEKELRHQDETISKLELKVE